MTTSGQFNLSSNMIVQVKDEGGVEAGPATNRMPMMVSEDGNFIGILYAGGNFIIYPQYILGDDKIIDATYISETQDEHSIAGHPVSIFVNDGQVYFFANGQNLFVSDQRLHDAYLIIREDGFYLNKPYTPITPPETVGPLTFSSQTGI